jgi:sugar diacid utilization regulator
VTVGPEIRPAVDLGSLEAITDAVESGLGLPEVVRAAARALEASLVLSDRAGAVLAVAARSSADERALMTDAAGVTAHDLRVGDEVVGRLRLRGRSGDPDPSLLRVVTTLIASEVSRLQAPERATAAAQDAFVRAVLDRALRSRAEIVGRAADIGLDLESGSVVVVVRAHNYAATEDDSRARVLAASERAARAAAPGSIAALAAVPADRAGQIVVMGPAADDAAARRVAEAVARELQAALHGFGFAVGHSRVAQDPTDLYRAGNEALLAANVAEPSVAGRAARRADARARLRGDGRLPAAPARHERGPR